MYSLAVLLFLSDAIVFQYLVECVVYLVGNQLLHLVGREGVRLALSAAACSEVSHGIALIFGYLTD